MRYSSRAMEPQLASEVREAIEPRLELWAYWSCAGVGSGQLRSQFSREFRREDDNQQPGSVCLVTVPDETAMQIEHDINTRLLKKEREVVISFWLHKGTITQKAKDCSCSIPTYYKRLDRAYERLFWAWVAPCGVKS